MPICNSDWDDIDVDNVVDECKIRIDKTKEQCISKRSVSDVDSELDKEHTQVVIDICQQSSDTIYKKGEHLLECRDDMLVDSGSVLASNSESSQGTSSDNGGVINLENELDNFVDTLIGTKTKKSRQANKDKLTCLEQCIIYPALSKVDVTNGRF